MTVYKHYEVIYTRKILLLSHQSSSWHTAADAHTIVKWINSTELCEGSAQVKNWTVDDRGTVDTKKNGVWLLLSYFDNVLSAHESEVEALRALAASIDLGPHTSGSSVEFLEFGKVRNAHE